MRPKRSPLDLVARADEKVIQLAQPGQKIAGSEDNSQSHPLKIKPEDFHF